MMGYLQRPEDASPLHGPEEVEQAAVLEGVHFGDDARVKHLARVPLFSACTEDELRRIARISKVVESPTGTTLTEAGAPGDSFFFIIDGGVSVQTQVGSGDPLRPGDFFGEMSLLDGEPRSATVIATTDVRLLTVEHSHFWRLLDESPDLVRRILVVLSRRVRRLEQVANSLLLGLGRT
jgi:CRP/FNR family cyclic AMP-dependent transcriptional regulator